MKCLICNKEYENKQRLGRHIQSHGLSAIEYKIKFNLIARCKKCGSVLKSKLLKTGFCTHCRDRTGLNNPFFGKTHTDETKQRLSQTSRKSTKSLWSTPEYRNLVIKNKTGVLRSEEFKREQSERITNWYKNNPEQRLIRSDCMKRSWRDGKIEPNINSINESKLEIELRSALQAKLVGRRVEKRTIRIKNNWFYPDIIIDKKIIVEFYGNFWHANPRIFKEDDIVHHSISAKEIWANDKKRFDFLKSRGYDIYVIWQDEYEKDKEKSVDLLIKQLAVVKG